MALKRVIVVAILAGAALLQAAAASAGHGPRVPHLWLVPLQRAQLGSAGASLALAYGSGPISSDGSSSGSIFIGQPGIVRGYALDYGDPFVGSTGVMEIRSSVEEYKSVGDAKKGMRFARLENRFLRLFSSPGITVTEKKLKPPPFGRQHFASVLTFAAPNLNPLVKLDEQVTYGKYVLDLTITAGSASAAEHIAPHLMQVLHHRLFLVLTGRNRGTAVALPPDPQPGQAPGGPDLSALILQPPDVGQPHAVNLIQAYAAGPPALSDFFMILEPAGTYSFLTQQIGWWPTATEARYAETYGPGLGGGAFGFGSLLLAGFGGTATPVDLSSVGDGATGYLVSDSEGSVVVVTLTNGQAGDSIVAASDSTLTASDVQNLAQAAADRLDAGL